jgi:hypothetical protein
MNHLLSYAAAGTSWRLGLVVAESAACLAARPAVTGNALLAGIGAVFGQCAASARWPQPATGQAVSQHSPITSSSVQVSLLSGMLGCAARQPRVPSAPGTVSSCRAARFHSTGPGGPALLFRYFLAHPRFLNYSCVSLHSRTFPRQVSHAGLLAGPRMGLTSGGSPLASFLP